MSSPTGTSAGAVESGVTPCPCPCGSVREAVDDAEVEGRPLSWRAELAERARSMRDEYRAPASIGLLELVVGAGDAAGVATSGGAYSDESGDVSGIERGVVS